jgi:hypothetical protein
VGGQYDTTTGAGAAAALDAAAPQPRNEDACAAAGLEMMTGVLDVVRDRQQVPDARLAAITDQDVDRMYWEHVGPAVDGMEGWLQRNQTRSYVDHDYEVVCDRAGLEVMKGYFDVLHSRDADFVDYNRLTVEDVTTLWEQYGAPAADSIEAGLLADSRPAALTFTREEVLRATGFEERAAFVDSSGKVWVKGAIVKARDIPRGETFTAVRVGDEQVKVSNHGTFDTMVEVGDLANYGVVTPVYQDTGYRWSLASGQSGYTGDHASAIKQCAEQIADRQG